MAWCRMGDKPLSQPMLTHFTNSYITLGEDELIAQKAVTDEAIKLTRFQPPAVFSVYACDQDPLKDILQLGWNI